jgi:hypothetical protein
MKKFVYFVGFLALALGAIPLFAQVLTPDTVYVPALPAGNLNTVINGDTLAGGFRAHPNRAYKLRRGSVYQVTAPMVINGSLTVIANDTTGNVRPPVLAPAILSDNSSIDHFFDLVGRGGKVAMSNVYLLSVRADQNALSWSDGFRISADSVKVKLRGVIFDAFSDAGMTTSGHWCKFDVQDCVFRNHQHPSAWFGGQPFMTGAPVHLDTVKFINNTFIANNSYSWSIRGYDNYAVFDHNTMIFGTVNPFLTRQGQHLRFRNNIFYAMHAMGGNPDHVINSWFLNYPDTNSSGIMMLRGLDTVSSWYRLWGSSAITGPEAYVDAAHGVTAQMVDPAVRTFDCRNNDYFWPKKYLDFVKAYNDTVLTKDSVDVPNGTPSEVKMYLKRKLYLPTWATAYTQWTIDSLAGKLSANIKMVNNQNVDPSFPAGVANHIDSLIAYVWKICTGKLDITWFYPNHTLYPPTWPLPENLAYTNTALQNAGSDGFALGDLNWFPSQKAAWLLTDVKNEPSPVPQEYTLDQNYPNPFNPTTKITYGVKSAVHVMLAIYNVLGQRVRTLADQEMAPGTYVATWDGRNDNGLQMATGVYFYRLEARSFVMTKSMMLLK